MKGERAGGRLAATVLRGAIGLILLASAVGKLLDLPGFAAVLRIYEALPGWAPTPAAIVVAELLLALWLAQVAGERAEPLGPERTRVTCTLLGDLGGQFPASALEKAWRAEPVQSVRAPAPAAGSRPVRRPSGSIASPFSLV